MRERANVEPKVALILGSGLGPFADEIQEPVHIPYNEIPHFPTSTVSGHKGRLVLGTIDGLPVVAMQGRFHIYEGYEGEQVVFPVRVLAALGIRTLVVTNAAGAVNRDFQPADLMLITDHINLMGRNPLVGPNDERLGLRFTDLTNAYAPELREMLLEVAAAEDIPMQRGVYLAVSGPTYETPAEIRMYRALGADACGMSTVPEVIAANHAGVPVLGISCITNMGAGITSETLDHSEVTEVANQVMRKFIRLLRAALARLA